MPDAKIETAPAALGPAARGTLPAVVPPAAAVPAPQTKRPRLRSMLLLVVLVAGAIGAGYWWLQPRETLPPGITFSNGRLEADEIDIDTKFAGRIAKLLADEGDMVQRRPGRRNDGYPGPAGVAGQGGGDGSAGAENAGRGAGEPGAAADPGSPGAAGAGADPLPGAERVCHQGGPGSAAAAAGWRDGRAGRRHRQDRPGGIGTDRRHA